MTIGILKEPSFEKRVSVLPETIKLYKELGLKILVESGAGLQSFASDQEYEEAGAEITTRENIISSAEIILAIHSIEEKLTNKTLFGVYRPLNNMDAMKQLAADGNVVFSMDVIPRTTRAQSMDVLSSQANIAGYKAVLRAADEFSRYFPMFMTAAGSIRPAKVLILGAGVAGLQAIATARRLGAVVEVFDTRPAVKEEVQSLGAKFVEVEGAADASSAGGYAVEQSEDYKRKQQEKINESAIKSDIIITTAQIPGRKAPLLISDEVLQSMKNGSVIVDLAAATGGNTSRTKNNEEVLYEGVKIIGNSNLSSNMPSDASKLYGKNIYNFLKLFFDQEGNYSLNFEDDLIEGTCLCKDGEIINKWVLSKTS